MIRVVFVLLFLPLAAAADGYGFVTPSGNIYCNGAVEVSDITCKIVEKSGSPPQPRPGSCNQTWGHAFNLRATGPAFLSCGPAPSRVNYTDIAPYGVTGEFGDITCRSEATGLSCSNLDGHGFFLSRNAQRIY